MGFFSNWCRNRRLKRRAIFKYHDGQRSRYADPYVIYRRLSGDPDVDLASVAAGYDADDPEDIDTMVALTRKVFDLPVFDEKTGRGLTSGEVMNLYFQYDSYFEQQKKNTNTGPTSSEPTDSESSTIPEAQDEAKRPSSDSTPINPESTPEPVIESSAVLPEESVQPLEVRL